MLRFGGQHRTPAGHFDHGLSMGKLARTASCLAVFSRWMLSVPVLVVEDCGVFASFRRSQQLTAVRTPAILFFVAHAAIAGYFAVKLPYYAFYFLASHFSLPAWSGWLPFILSFVFVAFTEPLCAIGCAEIYFDARETEASNQEEPSRSEF